jgi:hypothetical protein
MSEPLLGASLSSLRGEMVESVLRGGGDDGAVTTSASGDRQEIRVPELIKRVAVRTTDTETAVMIHGWMFLSSSQRGSRCRREASGSTNRVLPGCASR